MARHTPAEAKTVSLEDATPYVVLLQSAEYQGASDAHPDWPPQVKFVFQLSDDPDDTLWVWASIALGASRTSGKVSKLRAILNALAGKPQQEPIAAFDDETWMVEYPSGEAYPIVSGAKLTIVGHREGTAEQGNEKFVIDQFAAVKGNRPASRAANALGFGTDGTPAVISRAAELPAVETRVTPAEVPF